jgi:cation transport regulator ChaC
MSDGVWLFGYGSLVSRASFSHTLGRRLTAGVDFHEAELSGFERRWAYSIRSVPADAVDGRTCAAADWTITVLGVERAPDAIVNGVIGWVGSEKLAEFDVRERTYERVDVSALTAVHDEGWAGGPIVTYVPTSEPRRRYDEARARGTAVVDEQYWRLVDTAFAGLGADRRTRFHASTAAPEVPIVPVRLDAVPERHRVDGGG